MTYEHTTPTLSYDAAPACRAALPAVIRSLLSKELSFKSVLGVTLV